jgi:hypothetical protein
MTLNWNFRPMLLLAALALAACSGGDSSTIQDPSASPVAPPAGPVPPPAAQTGAVGIILTDAPDHGWDRALATINEISLLSDDGHVLIYEGEETVDLLDLGSYQEVFHIAEGVPVGLYEKIRLHVSRLELQRVGDEGEVIESRLTKLVANGKIDLNPRGGFPVVGDELLMVQLDWAMNKSLHIVEAGASGIIIVRPVVFVRILGEAELERFTRVHGVVRELTEDGFVLCQTQLVSAQHDEPKLRYCLEVLPEETAGIFDPAGDPAGQDAIQPEGELTAIGRLLIFRHQGHESGDEDGYSRLALQGLVMQLGPLGTFTRHPGVATSSVSDNSRFGLNPDSGELDAALLQQGTLIADRRAEIFGPEAIAAGVRGVFEGVPAEAEPGLLKSSFIVLDLDTPVEVLSGVLQEVLLETSELIVTTEETGDRCIDAGSAALYLLSQSDDELLQAELTLEELAAAAESETFDIEAFGRDQAEGCFAATVVFATAAATE